MQQSIALSVSEAACLEALRSGAGRKKVLIALCASLNLDQAGKALRKLVSLGLATTDGGRNWNLTPRGKRADISIAPPLRTRGQKPLTAVVPGSSAARLLALLDRPRRGAELPALLSLTRQRVHQLVVALSAFGVIRFADPNCPTFAIARTDESAALLRQDQERVLSAFPETDATTLWRVAVATKIDAIKVTALVESLSEAGLVEKSEATYRDDLYRLTAAGSGHWQRSATARRADIPTPPFRSERVRGVLSYLETRGPTRTRDIGLGLAIPQQSINALMQYLKRKNAVRTVTGGGARYAPYGLTPEGREMLATMTPARMAHDVALLAGLPAVCNPGSRRSVETKARQGADVAGPLRPAREDEGGSGAKRRHGERRLKPKTAGGLKQVTAISEATLPAAAFQR
jgi:DNA-binding MarR family transcriptional regulator